MISREDYHTVSALARTLSAEMEMLCSDCMDSDHRVIAKEEEVRANAEVTIAKIGMLTFGKGKQYGRIEERLS